MKKAKGILLVTMAELALAARNHLPEAARFNLPQGGNMLWIELPREVDGTELYQRAAAAGVSIVPGQAFTLDSGYRNYIRLSATTPFDSRIESGVAALGRLVDGMLGEMPGERERGGEPRRSVVYLLEDRAVAKICFDKKTAIGSVSKKEQLFIRPFTSVIARSGLKGRCQGQAPATWSDEAIRCHCERSEAISRHDRRR